MSSVNNYKLNGENIKFNQKRYYFIDNYPKTIHLYLLGSWFKVFNDDAIIIYNILDYKLYNGHYYYQNNICCGFPEYVLGKVEYYLDKYKINYNIINVVENRYELHDFEEENNYSEYLNNDYHKERIDAFKDEIKIRNDKTIEIGDTVIIKNLKDDELETFTIIPTYYDAKPVGINRGPFSFGTIKYRKELMDYSDIEKGEILSESPFAQILLGLSEGDIFIAKDKEAEDSEYQVITIQKEEKKF